jgi:aspartate aminotransferase-like enzyme
MREKYQQAVQRVEQLERQKVKISELKETIKKKRIQVVTEIQHEQTTAASAQHGTALLLMAAHHRYEIWDSTSTHADVIRATDSLPAALREYVRARRARRGHTISILRGTG